MIIQESRNSASLYFIHDQEKKFVDFLSFSHFLPFPVKISLLLSLSQ